MITIRFTNKGETGAIPISSDNLNLLIDQINENIEDLKVLINKTQHITADETKTTFDGTPVMHGSNEFVVTDEVGNVLSTSLNNIESEEI